MCIIDLSSKAVAVSTNNTQKNPHPPTYPKLSFGKRPILGNKRGSQVSTKKEEKKRKNQRKKPQRSVNEKPVRFAPVHLSAVESQKTPAQLPPYRGDAWSPRVLRWGLSRLPCREACHTRLAIGKSEEFESPRETEILHREPSFKRRRSSIQICHTPMPRRARSRCRHQPCRVS